MHARTWLARDTWRLNRRLWTLIVASFTALFVFLSTPWLTLAAIALLIGALGLAVRAERLALPPFAIGTWHVCALVMLAYLLVSLLWSGDPRATAITALTFTYLCLALATLDRLLEAVSYEWLQHITRALLSAYAIALAYMLIEELSDNVIKQALFRPFLAVRWRDGGLAFDFAHATAKTPRDRIKWNMPPVAFVLWPLLLMLATQLREARVYRIFQLIIVAAAALLSVLAEHRTTQGAIVASAAIFLIASFMPVSSVGVSRFLKLAWIAGFLLIIPVALVGYRMDMHLNGRLAPSMAARLILWNFTAEHLLQHPFVGVGAAATRRLDNEMEKVKPAERPEGYLYSLRTGPHAHNAFLQSWYELGLIGTALIGVLGYVGLATVLQAPPATQPYLLAAQTTVLFSISGSFGLFEPWFMGAIAMAMITSLIAIRHFLTAQETPPGQPDHDPLET